MDPTRGLGHNWDSMRTCPRCGRENPEENTFCGRCGTDLTAIQESVPADTDEPLFCYKHHRAQTHLRCGRCERPICTKCVVIGPAGPRCRDCAKQNIAVRPGAVVHEVSYGIRSLFRQGPWTIYIWILLATMLFGGVRGCMHLNQGPPPSYDSTQDEP